MQINLCTEASVALHCSMSMIYELSNENDEGRGEAVFISRVETSASMPSIIPEAITQST